MSLRTARLTWKRGIRTLKIVEVHLTTDQQAFVRKPIESGRLKREEDAVKEALLLWEERERRRAEILAAIDDADAALARGEGRRVSTHEELVRLAEDVKRRGLARLSAEKNTAS